MGTSGGETEGRLVTEAATGSATGATATAGVAAGSAVRFKVESPFYPAGDQPAAIQELSAGLGRGLRFQTLLGVTGSGKTATMAWVIEAAQRPALIIEPNKSLAAQLAAELRDLMPANRVEYFVSYYDYYQPEAYVPSSDLYIEKDSSINEEIDRLRHSATCSLLMRRDVVVVASVSCIYGLGSPEEYRNHLMMLAPGDTVDQRSLLRDFVRLRYKRNDLVMSRGHFRARGDTIEIHPAYEDAAVRIELFGDTVDTMRRFDPVSGEPIEELEELALLPATHYVAGEERMRIAVESIRSELVDRLAHLKNEGKLVHEQRLRMRTEHDLEMLEQVGVCNGIENYSRHLDGRSPGEMPYTLLDYFPQDLLVIVDESHVAVPQLHGQYEGDRSRKLTLVEYGFRLPSALDNRPLRFDEVMGKVPQVIFLSATPGDYELSVSDQVVEQVIRPTGLVDPDVVIRPTQGQIDDLLSRIHETVASGNRVLVTTLTKKMAEDLAAYLADTGVRVRYMHSDIDTVERIELIRDLRLGEYDVLVGINLLREGLDLPEVSLVAILDADKEGFLRSGPSLIQTIGRAARNVEGRVVLYADTVTDSMRRAVGETERRRLLQQDYNREHGIDPVTIRKAVTDILEKIRGAAPRPGGRDDSGAGRLAGRGAGSSGAAVRGASTPGFGRGKRGWERRDAQRAAGERPAAGESDAIVLAAEAELVEREMKRAAREQRYEEAAMLRDELFELRRRLAGGDPMEGDGGMGTEAMTGGDDPQDVDRETGSDDRPAGSAQVGGGCHGGVRRR